ncbi:hypothetical protein NDU88_007644 [Pleurodeles waltl]|uniref:Uncharacterized protein n=1 Tax=Pleurodeles waltl TaxID=8319 RepID=A0AAV7N416_PLEWA|nr:hypothetical protein NDU88_007644 [Pleurodeles waltl]
MVRHDVNRPVGPSQDVFCPDWLDTGMKRVETREVGLQSRKTRVEEQSDRDRGREKEKAGLSEAIGGTGDALEADPESGQETTHDHSEKNDKDATSSHIAADDLQFVVESFSVPKK